MTKIKVKNDEKKNMISKVKNHYFMLDGMNIREERDLDIIESCLRNIKNRTIALTKITDKIIVSTVFLCINHNFGIDPNTDPILFETIVFGMEDDYLQRYSTWKDALVGHLETVIKVAKCLKKMK